MALLGRRREAKRARNPTTRPSPSFTPAVQQPLEVPSSAARSRSSERVDLLSLAATYLRSPSLCLVPSAVLLLPSLEINRPCLPLLLRLAPFVSTLPQQ
ncbi:unnamed protein product [Linum trigynum]|uniref:Uncharacterized protein n=1 Tax=Linum trigynum TaxID=586398 RepID=A0AAV2GNI9_9ROSI